MNIAELMTELKTWFTNNVLYTLGSIALSIKDNIVEPVVRWFYNWILLPIYNWILSPLLSVASYIMELISDWILIPISDSIPSVFSFINSYIIQPIINGIVGIYNWFKNKIVNPLINLITSTITNIYESIRTSEPCGSVYELLQLKYTWQTKFSNKTKGDPIKKIANLTFLIRLVLFFVLAMTPLMLSLVGASGSHFFTIAIILAYSIAVSITFGATVSHNYHTRPDQAAITAGMFTSLAILGLVYINLATGGNIILIFSALIGLPVICFGLAHQPSMMQEKPIFLDFIDMFNTKQFMPPTYSYKRMADPISSDKIISEDVRDNNSPKGLSSKSNSARTIVSQNTAEEKEALLALESEGNQDDTQPSPGVTNL